MTVMFSHVGKEHINMLSEVLLNINYNSWKVETETIPGTLHTGKWSNTPVVLTMKCSSWWLVKILRAALWFKKKKLMFFWTYNSVLACPNSKPLGRSQQILHSWCISSCFMAYVCSPTHSMTVTTSSKLSCDWTAMKNESSDHWWQMDSEHEGTAVLRVILKGMLRSNIWSISIVSEDWILYVIGKNHNG